MPPSDRILSIVIFDAFQILRGEIDWSANY